jgi:hypothetical protein
MNLTLYKIIKEHKPENLQDNKRAQTLHFIR